MSFNPEMFPGIRALGNASDEDTNAYAFQVDEARRAKKAIYPPEYTPSVHIQTSSKESK